MTAKERRIAPRKACAILLRFRVLSHFVRAGVGAGVSAGISSTGEEGRQRLSGHTGIQDGQSINLSERGIYFKSASQLSVGEPLEIYFTLPTELTGRSPEAARCCARVVHIDHGLDAMGTSGVGAAIERFEPVRDMRTGTTERKFGCDWCRNCRKKSQNRVSALSVPSPRTSFSHWSYCHSDRRFGPRSCAHQR